MNEPNDHDIADVERVRADEKKIALAIALEERVKQHRIGRELADARIEACIKLMRKTPTLKGVLEPTIATWQRIRRYHVEMRQVNAELLRELST